MNGSLKYVLACALLTAFVAGCGGGGGQATPIQGPNTGAVQVLNNTGMDLANVAIYTASGTKIADTGGGLAQGSTYLFGDLAPDLYDVVAMPPGPGFQQVRRFDDNVVAAGQLTHLTMTP